MYICMYVSLCECVNLGVCVNTSMNRCAYVCGRAFMYFYICVIMHWCTCNVGKIEI